MNINTIELIVSDFLTVLKYLEKKNKFKYLFLQVHIFFSSILETLSIFTIIPIIETLNSNSENSFLKFLGNFIDLKYLSFNYLIIAFCVFLVLSNLYLIIIKKKIIDFGYVLMLDIQKKLFKKIIHNKYEFFINKDIAYFNNVILHEAQRIKGGFIESSLFILSQIFLVIFTFIGLMFYDYKITIFIIIVLFLFYLIYLFFVSERLQKVSKLNTEYKQNTIQYLNDIFSVIKTLIFKKNKSKFYQKLGNILEQNAKNNKFEQIIGGIIKNSFEIYFLIIILSVIIFAGVKFQIDSLLSYTVFAFAAYKIIPSFHLLYSNLIYFLGTSNALKVIAREIDNKNLYPEIIGNNLEINKIKLNNVTYSYDKRKKVISNVNYAPQKEKITGICGKSGSGKTTFIDLLSGLLSPTSGEVLINEKNFQNSNELLISNSAYCSQKTILIDDTIKNNICLETDNYVNENLFSEAIKIAELEDFIKSLNNGVDTIIGEGGIRVSGGEAQRINIARTIYSDRQFIFFDESFNNLDMITSKKVLQNLMKLQNSKTIFFITHDLRLLSDFQEILIFDQGKLAEKGSYSELKKSSKLFLELLQNEE